MSVILTNEELKTALGGSYASTADETMAQGARLAAERLVRNYVGYEVVQKTKTEFYPPRTGYEQEDLLIDRYEIVNNMVVPWSRSMFVNGILQLRNIPLRSIASIYYNPGAWDNGAAGDWPASTLLTAGPDYFADWEEQGLSWTGFIYRRAGWMDYPRSLKITYTAGLTRDELREGGGYEEFRTAVIMTATKLFNEMKAQAAVAEGETAAGPVQSERLADWGISYATASAERNNGFMRGLPISAARILEGRVRMSKYLDG